MHGDGRIYQRGQRWWIEYWHRGHQVRESSKSTNRRVAEHLLKERPVPRRLPLNRRRSLDHADRYVRHLRSAFGLDRALDITRDRIEVYKAGRLGDGLRPGAVNRELAAAPDVHTCYAGRDPAVPPAHRAPRRIGQRPGRLP
jgi:hypothetical protein